MKMTQEEWDFIENSIDGLYSCVQDLADRLIAIEEKLNMPSARNNLKKEEKNG